MTKKFMQAPLDKNYSVRKTSLGKNYLTGQAVILAAGNSTRIYPLSAIRPKPLLKVANKTIIEHNLEQIDGIVDEVFIVVGYKAEMIKDFLGKKFKKTKIRYIFQDKPLGNADALRLVKKISKEILF